MTVVECIVTWLNSYTELKFSLDEPDMLEKTGDVETELMSTDKLVIELIDGSRIVTDNYQIYAEKTDAVKQTAISNQQLLYNLENWIERNNDNQIYPDLKESGNITCLAIGLKDSTIVTSQKEDNNIYQVTINLTYLKERN